LNSRRLLLPLVAVALAAMLWSLQRHEHDAIVPATDAAHPPRYLIDVARLSRFNDEGRLTVRGTATDLEYFDDESARAKNLDADTFDDDQNSWNVTSPSVFMPAQTRKFLLEGNVVAKGKWPDSGLPVTVRTTQLWVDPDTHLLSTEQDVTLDSDGRDGSGTGLRADWVARRLQLLHNVKMRYDQRR
jgi:LPS export ABC transporter protein LptC